MHRLTSEKSNYDSHKPSKNLQHNISARLCRSVICQISPLPYKLVSNSKSKILKKKVFLKSILPIILLLTHYVQVVDLTGRYSKSDVYQKVFSMELIEVFHHLLSAA